MLHNSWSIRFLLDLYHFLFSMENNYYSCFRQEWHNSIYSALHFTKVVPGPLPTIVTISVLYSANVNPLQLLHSSWFIHSFNMRVWLSHTAFQVACPKFTEHVQYCLPKLFYCTVLFYDIRERDHNKNNCTNSHKKIQYIASDHEN